MPIFNMADLSREHNSSFQAGTVHNTDPALDIANEHHHEHLHHDAHAEKGHLAQDHVVYTTGTTSGPGVIPPADPNDDALHRRHHPEIEHDIEKNGGLYETEKASLDKGSPLPESSEEIDPKRHVVSRYYRRFRLPVHIFIGALFTG